jgi:hypothetical protein
MGGQPEMPSGDGEVGGDGEIFSFPRPQKGTVVSDSEADLATGGIGHPPPDHADESQLTVGWRI